MVCMENPIDSAKKLLHVVNHSGAQRHTKSIMRNHEYFLHTKSEISEVKSRSESPLTQQRENESP